jgi:hypothetical protein
MTSRGLVNTLGLALVVVVAGCTRGSQAPSEATSNAKASPAADPASSAAPAPAPSAAAPHVFRYELVLVGPASAAAARKFSMVVSDAAPGSVSVGKNVMISGGNRSDVGVKIHWQVTMRGDTPVLDVDAQISDVDATGKVHRVAMKGGAATPTGTSTLVVEATQDGQHYQLNATPTAVAALGGPEPSGKHVVDVAFAHAGGGGPSKSQLDLTLEGDAAAVAKHTETVPLVVGSDGGIAVPRLDVGTRAKAVGHPRTRGLDLDLDLELSAVEAGAPLAIRKIITHGPVFAPFDEATMAFATEEGGHRYEVTVTAHRAN